jgi:hypothetical protein
MIQHDLLQLGTIRLASQIHSITFHYLPAGLRLTTWSTHLPTNICNCIPKPCTDSFLLAVFLFVLINDEVLMLIGHKKVPDFSTSTSTRNEH